jgi:hypothetical protein
MLIMVNRCCLILLAFVSLLSVSAGKKPKIFVSFHIEAEESEGGKFVIPIKLGNHTYFFRKIPEITNKQISSFYRFKPENGSGWGIAFKLDNQGANRLASITSASTGKRLLATIHMRPVNFVVIDAPVRHGYAVIWSGVSDADIATFSKDIQETEKGGEALKKKFLDNDDYLRRDRDDAYDIAPKEEKKGFRFFRKKEKPAETSASPEDDFAPLP